MKQSEVETKFTFSIGQVVCAELRCVDTLATAWISAAGTTMQCHIRNLSVNSAEPGIQDPTAAHASK